MSCRNEIGANVEVFHWNELYETGISLIDGQHRQLIVLINRLAEGVVEHWTLDDMDGVFTDLVDYIELHFQTEEDIWSSYFDGSEVFTEHQNSHKSFIKEIQMYRHRHPNQPVQQTMLEVLEYLLRWLAEHILVSDMVLAKTVYGMGNGQSYEEARAQAFAYIKSRKVGMDSMMSKHESISTKMMRLIKGQLQCEKITSMLQEDSTASN